MKRVEWMFEGFVSKEYVTLQVDNVEGYAEKAWTAINLRSGDVPRSINLHVPVAV